MKYKIWSIQKKEYADPYGFGICADGKLYEFVAASGGQDCWLSPEDVSDEYEIHFEDKGL